MPVRTAPEITPQELLEKVEVLEELITYSGVNEPLKERAEKTLFIPSTTKTSIVTLVVKTLEKGTIEIFDGKGNHIENLNVGKGGESEFTVTFVLGANESWEWRKGAFAVEKVFSTYYLIGGIGTQGPQGEVGKEGKEGKEGPKGTGFSEAELEGKTWKKWLTEKLEKVKNILGEKITIEKVASIIGEAGSAIEGFGKIKSKEFIGEIFEITNKLRFAGSSSLEVPVPINYPEGGTQELVGATNDFKFTTSQTVQILAAIAAGVTLSGCAISSLAEGGKPWQFLIIFNGPTIEPGFEGDIKFLNENAGSKVANRFTLTAAEIVVKFNHFITFYYNPNTKKWVQAAPVT